MIDIAIKRLIDYGVGCGLVHEADRVFVTNQILEKFGIDDYSEPQEAANAQNITNEGLEQILQSLLDYAVENGMLVQNSQCYRDLFDTALMGILTPLPSTIINKFWELYKTCPQQATDYYFKFCHDTDYIRKYRSTKDIRWQVDTEYGVLDLTINLAKPEKDPRDIAAAAKLASSSYPKCLLCKQNEGYVGNAKHPARQNHRIIPIELCEKQWFLQYSPYIYYNEHCIVLNGEHLPMKIDKSTFEKLLDFVDVFPHYFVGSNADLPIVGGSILSHDHFQGGRYKFAIERAQIQEKFSFEGFGEIETGIVMWPLSVLRLKSKNRKKLVELSEQILNKWREYTEEAVFVFAETEGVPHNTVTPIARKNGECYEIDLVLRNNITTKEHPYGVFHPHEDLHHIKKENIGLIEVMGLAVLPARLKEEMGAIKQCLLNGEDLRVNEITEPHAEWVENSISNKNVSENNIDKIIFDEIGKVFCRVLEDSGVFKRDATGGAEFVKFIESAGGRALV